MKKQLACWFLLVGLITSLSGNLLVIKWARDYYLELNRVNLDPVGLRYYDNSAIAPKVPTRRRIVFYGDSRAFAWPTPVEFENDEVLNRGVGGQTTAQILARFEEHIASLQPDIVILQAGINDLKTIGLFPEQKAEILAKAKANLQSMVARSEAVGATVVLTTIFPTAEPSLIRRPFWSAEIDGAIVEVNAFLATLVDDRVVLFDSASILADSNGAIQPQYSYDLLHLNEDGYAALNVHLPQLALFQQ